MLNLVINCTKNPKTELGYGKLQIKIAIFKLRWLFLYPLKFNPFTIMLSHSQILLILSSGFGVLLGILLSIFLWSYRKGNPTANKILCLLILTLSFRVGKSVFMELGDGIDLRLIFIGLSTQLVLGPLCYLYTKVLIADNYKLTKQHLIHFLPFIPALGFGFWISKNNVEQLPTSFFVILFCIYYGHYLTYLLISLKNILSVTESQKKDTTKWLKILVATLSIIWLIYVLNLFEDIVPYIVGPISYSLLIFIISFIAFKNGYIEKAGAIKYKTTTVEQGEIEALFHQAVKLIRDQEQFKDNNISLKSLSECLKTSTQKLSMAINSGSSSNFNVFVNSYRIAAAKQMFQDQKYANYTIAAIAYEVGFNSLSSFNEAFKKQNKQTPMAYKNQFQNDH